MSFYISLWYLAKFIKLAIKLTVIVAKIAQEQQNNWLTKFYFSQGNTSRPKKTVKMDKRISLKVIDDTKVLVYDNYSLVISGIDRQS